MLSHKFVVLFHSYLFILLSVSFWLSGVQRKSHPRLVNLTCFPFIGRVRAPKHSFLYWGCWHFIFLRSWDEPKEKKNKYKTKSNPKGCTKSPPFISYKMPSIIYWNFYNSKKFNYREHMHSPYLITDCVLGEWTLYVSESMVVQKRIILILS